MTKKVTVKLFAGLMKYLPVNDTKSHGFEYKIANDATVGHLIDDLKLPRDSIHIVLLNGVYLDVDSRETTQLQDADVVGFWPAVAGG